MARRIVFELRFELARRLRILAAVLIVSLLASSGASALPFSNLIVFGDSIVDQGNTQFLAVGVFGPGADPTPASAGYFGGRFTNGINPADVVNQAVEGSNSVGSTSGGDNYAFGGARARNDGDFLPDLVAQIDIFNTGAGAGGIDPNALIMINVGGNDVRDIAIDGLIGAARQQIIDDAVAAITTGIGDLVANGAQNILFVGVGDVGSIPELLALGGTASADGRQASLDLNAAIQAALPSSVDFFDTIALFDAIALDPTAFGFPPGTDFTNACIGTASAPTCSDFAFFDDVHPTTQVLQLLGNELVAFVPEPGTGLLMMLGLMGLAIQRRREAN